MGLRFGFLGSTQVSKEILEDIQVEPELVISFTDAHRDRISGFARYEEYSERWVQVDSMNGQRAKEVLDESDLDILLVMAWQELLDAEVLSIPEVGCVGRHLSLLPKRRGRAPVAWALIHGLEETGVSLFWLDEGVDTGDIVSQKKVDIDRTDEARDLHEKMTHATVDLLNDVIPSFEAGEFPRESQDDEAATYTHPRRPDMGLIDWGKSSQRLYDFIRGQSEPYPGAFTYNAMDKVIVWHASIVHPTATRGRVGEVLRAVTDDTYYVQTGEGVVEVETENTGGDHPIEVGDVLGSLP